MHGWGSRCPEIRFPTCFISISIDSRHYIAFVDLIGQAIIRRRESKHERPKLVLRKARWERHENDNRKGR